MILWSFASSQVEESIYESVCVRVCAFTLYLYECVYVPRDQPPSPAFPALQADSLPLSHRGSPGCGLCFLSVHCISLCFLA